MSNSMGEHVADDYGAAEPMSTERADRIRAERFAPMSAHDLANTGTAVGYLLIARQENIAGATVLEMAGRIREPMIGRWPVFWLGIIVGGCVVLAVYTGFERPATKADRNVTIIEKTVG